jgi:hypothetical protein
LEISGSCESDAKRQKINFAVTYSEILDLDEKVLGGQHSKLFPTAPVGKNSNIDRDKHYLIFALESLCKSFITFSNL